MKILVIKTDIIEAMSGASMQSAQGGERDEQILINTSTRPPIQPIDTSDLTKTISGTLYTKGSCPSCMAC